MIAPEHAVSLNNLYKVLLEISYLSAVAEEQGNTFAAAALDATTVVLCSIISHATLNDLGRTPGEGAELTPEDYDEAGLYYIAQDLRMADNFYGELDNGPQD
jgi:hypothetical protein